jgi:hypothetical protein
VGFLAQPEPTTAGMKSASNKKLKKDCFLVGSIGVILPQCTGWVIIAPMTLPEAKAGFFIHILEFCQNPESHSTGFVLLISGFKENLHAH